jgi:hypothetical protein
MPSMSTTNSHLARAVSEVIPFGQLLGGDPAERYSAGTTLVNLMPSGGQWLTGILSIIDVKGAHLTSRMLCSKRRQLASGGVQAHKL